MRGSWGTAIVACIALGCGGAKGGNDGGMHSGGQDLATSSALKLSGMLIGGSVTFSHLPGHANPDTPSGPLAGYQLDCVTFSMPAVAGSGTADASGSVTVSFAARNTPFGCFVLDTSNAPVATLIFTSGSARGQTVTLTGDADLGAITVDGTSGVAKATLTAGAIAPGTSSCPGGTWTLAGGTTSSCGMEIATLWAAAVPGGTFLVSFTDGPKSIGSNICGYGSQGIDNAGTYSGGALRFAIVDTGRPTCNSHLSFVATPDAACKTMSIVASLDNCGPCKAGMADCNGCGTNTCSATHSGFVKQ